MSVGETRRLAEIKAEMKRFGNLYDRIISIENLDLAERKARKGKGKRKDVADLPQGSIVPSAGMFAAMSLMQTPQPKPTQYDRPLAGGFGSDNGMASLMVSQ